MIYCVYLLQDSGDQVQYYVQTQSGISGVTGQALQLAVSPCIFDSFYDFIDIFQLYIYPYNNQA